MSSKIYKLEVIDQDIIIIHKVDILHTSESYLDIFILCDPLIYLASDGPFQVVSHVYLLTEHNPYDQWQPSNYWKPGYTWFELSKSYELQS